MSHHLFYSILQQNLTNCSDKGSTLKRMVIHIHKLIQHVLNKSGCASNCKYLEMFVDMNFKLEFIWDERLPEVTQRVRLEIILPASNLSIMQLPERMEIDDDDQCLKDLDCVICLEDVGKNILCLPCSHMFHRNCITTWLHKNRYCPICRYGMPTIFDEILESYGELDS
ncbi:hypothetical protein H5410_014182 [Solanum commersonii]|uniref:RING-type E3 ubiquitin transferase n=1 Tax=Solanum commersonii TaxID=4109 RepID=A0A9J5ZQ96_SOLCO|nr:hypothetical protein H5410_014182 [Solanum commersonii]